MGFPTSLIRPILTQHRSLLALTPFRPPLLVGASQAAPKSKASSSAAATKPKPKSAAADKPAKAAVKPKPKAKVPLSHKSPNGTEDSDADMGGGGSDVDDFDGKSASAPTPGAKGLGKDIKELGGQAGKGKNASEMYQKVSAASCVGTQQRREEPLELTMLTSGPLYLASPVVPSCRKSSTS
jgi:hypothetical protein